MGKESFLYNKSTHTLHIKGYCWYTNKENSFIPFHSEDEVLAYDGRSVGFCKLCQRQREKLLEEIRK